MLDLSFFLDTYYTYDFNRPKVDRVFTTQPTKHDSPSINLAHVDWKLSQDKVRSRLAFHAGDSVERNAITEPGPEKYIQESYVGFKIGDETWLDGGIFYGHIGAEAWVSKDNWTYTRALNLDYVPYYSAGLRLQHQLNPQESFQFQVINGWQNISENNSAKAVGMQYKNILTEKIVFTYNNFFGDEQVVSNKPRFRGYHNFILENKFNDLWQFLFAVDFGHQSQQTEQGVDTWSTSTITTRRIIDFNRSLALRLEHYNDAQEANVKTPLKKGFIVQGGSINYDQILLGQILWRTEYRYFQSKQKIYPLKNGSKSNNNSFIVSSLSVSF